MKELEQFSNFNMSIVSDKYFLDYTTQPPKTVIGTIFADNLQDKSSLDSIRFGFYSGDGLFYDVVTCVKNLEEAALAYGTYGDESHYEILQSARVALFNALKNIERKAQ